MAEQIFFEQDKIKITSSRAIFGAHFAFKQQMQDAQPYPI
jgi:hypothetical protein